MRDLGEIWSEIRNHPDFIEAVIWTREDVECHVQDLADDGDTVTASVYDIMEHIRMDGWEDYAIECGWDVIYQQVQEHGEIEYKEENND